MPDRPTRPKPPPTTPHGTLVVDLSDRTGRKVRVLDEDYTVEWQIDRPVAGEGHHPSYA